MMSTLGETPGMPGEEVAPPNGNNTSSPLSSSTSPRRKKKLQAIMNDYTTKTVRVKVGNEEVVMTARELEEEMMNMEDEMEEEKNVIMGGGDDDGISGDQGMMTMGQMMSDGGGVGKCTFIIIMASA